MIHTDGGVVLAHFYPTEGPEDGSFKTSADLLVNILLDVQGWSPGPWVPAA